MANTLQERLAELVPEWRTERINIIKEYGQKSLGEATVGAAFGGMRGI